MDNRAEIREFLVTRRAKIAPVQAGLQPGGGRRRVPGLRREEVAVLAGVSTEWYVRLEKGHISGVSDEVLRAVARALQLDEAERLHLFDLARAATPAFIRNGRLDVLAVNPPGQPGALLLPRPGRAGLLPRLGRGRPVHRRAAAHRGRPRPLRPRAPVRDQALPAPGRGPDGRRLRLDAAARQRGPGLTLTCYSAESGSPSDDALKMLASWTASSLVRSPVSPGDDLSADERTR